MFFGRIIRWILLHAVQIYILQRDSLDIGMEWLAASDSDREELLRGIVAPACY